MPRFELQYISSYEDDIAFALFLAAGHKEGRRGRFVSKLIFFTLFLTISCIVIRVLNFDSFTAQALATGTMTGIAIGFLVFSPMFRLKKYASSLRRYLTSFKCRRTDWTRYVHIDEHGVRVTSEVSYMRLDWRLFSNACVWRDYLFIYNGVFGYLAIPIQACSSRLYAQELAEFCRNQIKATKS